MPKSLKEVSLYGESDVSVPLVASQVRLHRATLSRWASRGSTPNGHTLKVVRDKTNGHLYIAEGSVETLKKQYVPEVRFELVAAVTNNGANGCDKVKRSTGKARLN